MQLPIKCKFDQAFGRSQAENDHAASGAGKRAQPNQLFDQSIDFNCPSPLVRTETRRRGFAYGAHQTSQKNPRGGAATWRSPPPPAWLVAKSQFAGTSAIALASCATSIPYVFAMTASLSADGRQRPASQWPNVVIDTPMAFAADRWVSCAAARARLRNLLGVSGITKA